MQTTMTLDACARCGQPIAPGEPAMQTAAVKETKLGRRHHLRVPAAGGHQGRLYPRQRARGGHPMGNRTFTGLLAATPPA